MATIQGIYIALFGRPADPLGLAFFEAETQGGADLTAIGDLSATAEYQSRFEGMNSAQIVTAIYQSLFGRPPELAGLQFFVAELESGRQNINTIAINILDGAQGDDALVVANKIAAADLWTAAVAADPAALAAYQGQVGIDAGVAFLAGITADPATVPTEAQVDAALNVLIGDAQAGSTFILTTAIDSLMGTDGNDTFVGLVGETDLDDAGAVTAGPGDTINGGLGYDTFEVTVTGSSYVIDNHLDGMNITNVERFVVKAPDDGGDFNMSVFDSALELIDLQVGYDGSYYFYDLNSEVDIRIAPTRNDPSYRDVYVDLEGFAPGVWDGDDDHLNVSLLNAGDVTKTGATWNFNSAAYMELQDNAGDYGVIENLNVHLEGGRNYFEFYHSTNADGDYVLQNVTITGAAEALRLDLNTTDVLESIDASGATVRLDFDHDLNPEGDFSYNGSQGADLFVLNLQVDDQEIDIATNDGNDEIEIYGNFDVALTVDLGAGNDQLYLDWAYSGASITLGAGNDSLEIGGALDNLDGVSAAAVTRDVIAVTDFNGSQDYLDIGLTGFTTLNNLQAGLAEGAASLTAALTYVAGEIGINASTAFVYDGSTYIYQNDADAAFDAGDGLLQLTGFTGDLTMANASFV